METSKEKKYVMIIAEDLGAIDIMKAVLSGDYELSVWENGFTALETVAGHRPDLIVAELDMLFMDGIEILEKASEGSYELSGIPIIILAGTQDMIAKEKCIDLGAADYLIKPFIPSVFKKHIEQVIENTEKKKALSEEIHEIQEKARRDQLTGLWNRDYSKKTIDAILKNGRKGSLFMIDLDNFKAINDNYGHDAGDDVLRMFADTLRLHMRDNDIPARLGGDEFIAFVEGLTDRDSLSSLAGRIVSELKEKLDACKFDTNSSVSLGIAITGADGYTFDDLYNSADKALYVVKTSGKNSFCFAGDIAEADASRSSILEDMDSIHSILLRSDDDKMKAYAPGLAALTHIYQFLKRQSSIPANLILFSIIPAGNPDEAENNTVAALFEQILKNCLRRTDAVARYSSKQFIVLTTSQDKDGLVSLVERIHQEYLRSGYQSRFLLNCEMDF